MFLDSRNILRCEGSLFKEIQSRSGEPRFTNQGGLPKSGEIVVEIVYNGVGEFWREYGTYATEIDHFLRGGWGKCWGWCGELERVMTD